MSVIRPDGTPITLEPCGPASVWATLHRQYGGHDPLRLKRLAMLALREEAHWPLEWIGNVFSHHKGHVSRSLKRTMEEIRDVLEQYPARNTADERIRAASRRNDSAKARDSGSHRNR